MGKHIHGEALSSAVTPSELNSWGREAGKGTLLIARYFFLPGFGRVEALIRPPDVGIRWLAFR